jgi:hypothetical protein
MHPVDFGSHMLQSIVKKSVGSRNDRLRKQYMQKVRAINALEPACTMIPMIDKSRTISIQSALLPINKIEASKNACDICVI